MTSILNSNDKVFTILLVDDREENLIALEDMLEGENRHFIKATSGNDALKYVLKNENIGLIMLDVQMPGMDGFEVAKLLKSNPKTRDISIIFVTAINKEQQYVMKGYSHGAVDYLQKPLDPHVTKAKVSVFEHLHFYQQSLKDSLEEVERINKQLERFVYIVSHDLKSPLSAIITLLSVMGQNENVNKQADVRDHVEMLSQAANHLSDMIGSILEYSRKSIGQQTREEVDVRELVLQIAYLLFPPKRITIDVVTEMPVLNTRKLKLQQVFQNLISNAIKYNNKPNGVVEIGCNDKEGEFYEFFVRDNGPGIAPEDRKKIFQLFHVTNNVSTQDSSTGVGLNILKMLIEEQGGRIWVESQPHEGSSFFFEWRKQ
ncbi:His Kinase A (phospho-acceptor) domain-containing protein [Filimonas lacunae]|uniref:histidine kinase n=1 Tax=Filimonas lacunae TaxID=477680 RepID=A0A173MKM6_9BACT|nr:hybrid sensor histidine kinase/response regulator [Filimonas lacunae]BAV08040.1 chemotaxis regulator - transmits chemoreceptor signals to flagelllar motor components cheY [Filimonas lacunae]SIT08443.1 His Kinase A (phospho-acceptor) domain-containing protein [Filimonas lacunae]